MTISLRSKGVMLAISAPSGGGKSSLIKSLLETENNLTLSVSVTTRLPRQSELDGVHYHFKTMDEFQSMLVRDMLLEHTHNYGHYYGSPKAPIESALSQGRDVLFDIDWNGARAIGMKHIAQVATIFLLPPSIAELRKRLELRNQNTKEDLERRIAEAEIEIKNVIHYDYAIVNDDFDVALSQLRAILVAERAKLSGLDKLKLFYG